MSERNKFHEFLTAEGRRSCRQRSPWSRPGGGQASDAEPVVLHHRSDLGTSTHPPSFAIQRLLPGEPQSF
jgi:hypothetical protein